MPNGKDLKLVAVTVAGVMIAGYVMEMLSDVAVIRDAKRGFGG